MALSDIIRSAVAVANDVTSDLQATVTHYAWTGQDETGAPTFASGKRLKALVEHKQRSTRTLAGNEIVVKHRVTFLTLPRANGATNRREPIDPRDKIVLPNGETGPILDIEGFVDAESRTGGSYLLEVLLG